MMVEYLSPALSIQVDLQRAQARESWSSFLNVHKQTISCEELTSQWFLYIQEQARAPSDHRSWYCTEHNAVQVFQTVQQLLLCAV